MKAARCPVCGGDGLFTRAKDPDPYSDTPVEGEECWGCQGKGWVDISRRKVTSDCKFDYVDVEQGFKPIKLT